MDGLASAPPFMSRNFPVISSAERAETIAALDFLSQLPKEVILKIFGYLGIIELTKCSEVSRRWKRLASDDTLWKAADLRTIFPSLKVFDESDWVTHVDLPTFGLEAADASSFDKRQAIPALKKCLSSLQIEGEAGITLLTIPKGLTLNTLKKVAESPKIMSSALISEELGDVLVNETYRILITNNILKESRGLSVCDHEAFVIKTGCEMPKALEVAVLLFVTFVSSGKRLYGDDDYTFTRCSEQVSGRRLIVWSSYHNVNLDCNDDADVSTGVGGVLRKF